MKRQCRAICWVVGSKPPRTKTKIVGHFFKSKRERVIEGLGCGVGVSREKGLKATYVLKVKNVRIG